MEANYARIWPCGRHISITFTFTDYCLNDGQKLPLGLINLFLMHLNFLALCLSIPDALSKFLLFHFLLHSLFDIFLPLSLSLLLSVISIQDRASLSFIHNRTSLNHPLPTFFYSLSISLSLSLSLSLPFSLSSHSITLSAADSKHFTQQPK